MKKILISFLVAISMSSVAQTELEKKVLSELNSYRASYKLSPVSWDPVAYKAADHHSQWMSKVGFSKMDSLMEIKDEKVGLDAHYESIDVPNFVEIFDPLGRGKKFGLPDNAYIEEICNMARSSDASSPIIVKMLPDNKLAKHIILKFSKSPPHNDAMLQKNDFPLKAAVRSIVIGEIVYTTIYFIEKLD